MHMYMLHVDMLTCWHGVVVMRHAIWHDLPCDLAGEQLGHDVPRGVRGRAACCAPHEIERLMIHVLDCCGGHGGDGAAVACHIGRAHVVRLW